jgi:hypothetical protein
MGIVSPPLVNVKIKTNAPNGVQQINLFWNGVLVATKKSNLGFLLFP